MSCDDAELYQGACANNMGVSLTDGWRTYRWWGQEGRRHYDVCLEHVRSWSE
jgi:hypothetical protein